ncbi:MAG TPA: LptF/LptG family permease [Cytophagales bacterium]|nr:LptF/LptG family permease [Cytophagales bacterium]
MFKTIDKYIIKKILTSFVFITSLLIAVICIVDYTEKSDEFVNLDLGFIVMNYFVYFIPYMANLVSPLLVFITTVFVTARLASHTEIIAILSSGVSYKRMLWPYVVASSVIGALTFVLIAWYLPGFNKKRLDFEIKYYKNQYSFGKRNYITQVRPGEYLYIESYNNDNKTGYGFTWEKHDSLGEKLLYKYKASFIKWDTTKNKWRLEGVEYRSFMGDKEVYRQLPPFDTTLVLTSADFESKYMEHEKLTITELDDKIATYKLRGELFESYEIEKYERYAYPFAIVILTTIGVIVSSRKVRGGAGLQIALGFVLAFVYIFFVFMGRTIASSGGIPAMLSAWIPNIIFGIIGFALYWRVPK